MSVSISDSKLEVFRLVVDQAPDAIIFADRQGMIQVWNKAAADLFGFPADEVLGLSLDIIIPERLRHAHWEGFGRAVASGHMKHGRGALKTRATRKDGRRLYVSLAFSVVNDRDGKVIAQWRQLANYRGAFSPGPRNRSAAEQGVEALFRTPRCCPDAAERHHSAQLSIIENEESNSWRIPWGAATRARRKWRR